MQPQGDATHFQSHVHRGKIVSLAGGLIAEQFIEYFHAIIHWVWRK